MNKLKVWVGVLLIFVLGALAGSLGTGLYIKHRIGEFVRGGPPSLMHLLMRRMSQELDLTEAQESEIEKIVEQSNKKMSDFRERYHPEFEKILDDSFALIKKKLSEEQKIKLDKLQEDLKKRRGHRGPPGIFQPYRLDKKPEHLIAFMKERLNLSKEQEEKVRPIIEESIEKKRSVMRKKREQGWGNMGSMKSELQAVQEATEQQLEAILTKEQMEEYRKIQEEHRPNMFSEMPEPPPMDLMEP